MPRDRFIEVALILGCAVLSGCMNFSSAYDSYCQASNGCAPVEPQEPVPYTQLLLRTHIYAYHHDRIWDYGPVLTNSEEDFAALARSQMGEDMAFVREELCPLLPEDEVWVTEYLREFNPPELESLAYYYSIIDSVRCP